MRKIIIHKLINRIEFKYNLELPFANTLPRQGKKYKKHYPYYLRNTLGIYFLFNKDKLVYVGKTHHLKQRLISHSTRIRVTHKVDLKVWDEFAWVEFDDELDCTMAEIIYIEFYKPEYNKTIW